MKKVREEEGGPVATGRAGRAATMRNQRGEAMTGAMIVIMVVAMLFGGMHFMQRDSRHYGRGHHGGDRSDHQHSHGKDETEHSHNHTHDDAGNGGHDHGDR